MCESCREVRSRWESLILEPALGRTALAQGLVLLRALSIHQIQIKKHCSVVTLRDSLPKSIVGMGRQGWGHKVTSQGRNLVNSTLARWSKSTPTVISHIDNMCLLMWCDMMRRAVYLCGLPSSPTMRKTSDKTQLRGILHNTQHSTPQNCRSL